MCALLGSCLIQAQNQKRDCAKKQGEIDCLKVELMCSLEQKIEIMLAQEKRPPSITQIRKIIMGANTEDLDGDIWGD